jgi:poly-gamma-glutamate capsule biosynthesis protein CapA/YwtB (metallophosphatase superfamily)
MSVRISDADYSAVHGFVIIKIMKWLSIFIALAFTGAFSQQVTVSFLGDCTIGCDVRWTAFDEYVKRCGYAYFFSGVKSILAADDYTVANLETAIVDTGTPIEKQFRFRGKPEYLDILREGSVECVSTANNHAWDYGDSGYAATQRHLDSVGIGFFGYDKVLLKEIKGLRFAFIGQSFTLQDSVLARIKSLRESVDFIIVVMHWGQEREYHPDKKQRDMGHALIDAGADLVVGHHPHVLQPVEKYRGRYIAYSLGNFVFGGNINPREKRTEILQAVFAKNQAPAIKEIPCRISSVDSTNDFRPVIERK